MNTNNDNYPPPLWQDVFDALRDSDPARAVKLLTYIFLSYVTINKAFHLWKYFWGYAILAVLLFLMFAPNITGSLFRYVTEFPTTVAENGKRFEQPSSRVAIEERAIEQVEAQFESYDEALDSVRTVWKQLLEVEKILPVTRLINNEDIHLRWSEQQKTMQTLLASSDLALQRSRFESARHLIESEEYTDSESQALDEVNAWLVERMQLAEAVVIAAKRLENDLRLGNSAQKSTPTLVELKFAQQLGVTTNLNRPAAYTNSAAVVNPIVLAPSGPPPRTSALTTLNNTINEFNRLQAKLEQLRLNRWRLLEPPQNDADRDFQLRAAAAYDTVAGVRVLKERRNWEAEYRYTVDTGRYLQRVRDEVSIGAHVDSALPALLAEVKRVSLDWEATILPALEHDVQLVENISARAKELPHATQTVSSIVSPPPPPTPLEGFAALAGQQNVPVNSATDYNSALANYKGFRPAATTTYQPAINPVPEKITTVKIENGRVRTYVDGVLVKAHSSPDEEPSRLTRVLTPNPAAKRVQNPVQTASASGVYAYRSANGVMHLSNTPLHAR